MEKSVSWEVCQKANSTLPRETIENMAREAIVTGTCVTVGLSKIISPNKAIQEHIESIVQTDDVSVNNKGVPSVDQIKETRIFVYRLSQEGAATETMQHESEELSVASHIILPALGYQGLWESLHYEENIKNRLLNYFETAITFAEKKVDANIISLNKVILLHGPPGTGKTSLCRALAHKAAIRLGDKYSCTELIEIHSHSLFSKWFSESGKLVMKLFDEVRRLLENPKTLVCVLIDEVESLTHARKSCANGNEPSDALRVVNAVLTQLDQIKSYPNVMILTTSNVTEMIDLAFVDRADIKQFVGHPGQLAIGTIYLSCILELMRAGLVTSVKDLGSKSLHEWELVHEGREIMAKLDKLSESSVGLSGRSLRKIPFLAYAMYFRTDEVVVTEFVDAMAKALDTYKKSESLL